MSTALVSLLQIRTDDSESPSDRYQRVIDQLATIAEVEISTFPVVFFNEIFIGGYTESKDHLNMME